jgi:hypothetical protein
LDTSTEQARTWAWVEHRRWNAYIRTRGFCSAPKTEHKEVFQKLHPCLVEAASPSLEAAYAAPEVTDFLDAVSLQHDKMKPAGKARSLDYKEYDYPKSDFDQTVLAQQTEYFAQNTTPIGKL